MNWLAPLRLEAGLRREKIFMPAPLQAGTLLIATLDLQDPNFCRTIVLILDHDEEEGTLGLVLNRPLGDRVRTYSAEELLRLAPAAPDGSPPDLGSLFFAGGPCRRDRLFFLHRLGHLIQGSMEIAEGVYLGGDLDAVRAESAVLAAKEPLLRFYLGYASWSQGQLEYEIVVRGAWILAPASPGLILSLQPDTMWQQALYSLGGKYRPLSVIPEDPALN
jgi:putative transcriptional regulator